MTKLTLALSTLIHIAAVSAASANSGAPRMNGQNTPYGERPLTAAQGYSALYEGRTAAADPAPTGTSNWMSPNWTDMSVGR